MSDTPRMDAAEREGNRKLSLLGNLVVVLDEGRKIERELVEALVDAERYRVRRKQVFDLRNRLQVSGPRATWEEFCKEYDDNKPHHEVG